MKVSIRSCVVREHLARRHITQNNLAQKVGVSRGYLSQLLRGRRCPGPDVRVRLLDALRIDDFDALFVLTADPREPVEETHT